MKKSECIFLFLFFCKNFQLFSQEVELKQQADTTILEEVTITGGRIPLLKSKNVISVSVLEKRIVRGLSSTTISELLNFSPGIRVETNCQTCNYTQVRMNGLAGSYTQLLINNRPLFSSLMGLYGLEQIPSSLIEQIEVVKGGGSVLYGSNAIAGTINVLTKAPKENTLDVGVKESFFGRGTVEHNLQFTGTVVSKNRSFGLELSGFHKSRDGIDRNGDGFTEIPRVSSTVLLMKGFVQLSRLIEMKMEFWSSHEQRQGGDFWKGNPQEASQSEFRNQITTIGQFQVVYNSENKRWNVELYSGMQNTNRRHYTGIDQVDAWGKTWNLSTNSGIQAAYKHRVFPKLNLQAVVGMEHNYEVLKDTIRFYGYFVNQQVNQLAGFMQVQTDFGRKWSVITGFRMTYHSLVKHPLAIPRIGLLYKPNGQWQLRASYGMGFKAPQVFETDMHMAFANGGVSKIVVDVDLKSERSHAFTGQVNWSRQRKKMLYSIEINGFYTQLQDAFVLQEIEQDEMVEMLLMRTNGSDARVYGTSGTIRVKYASVLQVDLSYTQQESMYDDAVSWSLDVAPTRRFLRTPNSYGSIFITLFPERKWTFNTNGVYTGSMLIPHVGGAPELEYDELELSSAFFDCGFRLERSFHFHRSEQTIRIGLGIQNVFDSYQKHFDTTKFRDSNYIYGPARPRTYFLDLKWSIGQKHGN